MSKLGGMSQADAYRKHYKVRPGTKDETVWQNASRIANDTNVIARISKLKQELALLNGKIGSSVFTFTEMVLLISSSI